MKSITAFAYLTSGVVAGVITVVACSDDSPGNVDAADAACDCPAAEPPLAGRIVSVRATNLLAFGSSGLAGAECPTGATILGGACDLDIPDNRVLLTQAKIDRSAGRSFYVCYWSTLTATETRNGTAEAICLMPAQ
jgi:hypothetical protein